jgi:ADP-ribosylglycohydrolase
MGKIRHWTPHGTIFDIGIATSQAIHRKEKVQLFGGTTEFDNGNGSLMRILPFMFYIEDFPLQNF